MSAADRARLSDRCAAPDTVTECDASMVGNMNMDKDVATRLFRMLAVNEQTVNSVKRDHSSYAKLSLLTQQMQLLQKQATGVVEKCEEKVKKQARIDEPEIEFSETRLIVSDEYDEGAKRLLSMITVNEKTVLAVAKDTASCAKLSVLADQVGLLQEQAQSCVDEAELNRRLLDLGERTPGTRIVPGTVYYHYIQNGREVLSRIANDEWCNYDEYLGKYLYDHDFTFRKLVGKDVGIDVLSRALMLPAPKVQEAVEGASTIVDETPATPFAPSCPVLSRW